jgi:hypothetical protein
MGMNQPFFKNTQQHQMLFLATPLIKYSYQPFAEAIEQLVVWFTLKSQHSGGGNRRIVNLRDARAT